MIERLSAARDGAAEYRRLPRHERLRLLAGELADARPDSTPVELADARERAAGRLQRPLSLAEAAVDLVGLDRDLAEGKARLAAAIDAEKRRAIRRAVATGIPVRLQVTPEILAALAALYRAGQSHAREEIRTLTGLSAADSEELRAYATPEIPSRVHDRLAALLRDLSTSTDRRLHVAVSERAVAGELGGLGEAAVTAAVLRVPGALDVASRLVSTAMFSGVGDVYSAATGLFAGWQYSAVADAATCDPCSEKDGTEYPTWEEAMADLPDGGPNPDCDGDGRCRCRLVPLAGDGVAADDSSVPVVPEAEAVAEALPEGVDPADRVGVELARARIAFNAELGYNEAATVASGAELERVGNVLAESRWVDPRTRTGELRGERRPTPFASEMLARVQDTGRTVREELDAVVERETAGAERRVAELEARRAALKTEFDLAHRAQQQHVEELRQRLIGELDRLPNGGIDWDEIRRRVNFDDENARLIEAFARTQRLYREAADEIQRERTAVVTARREALRDLLRRSGREVGGQIEAAGSKEVAESLRVAADHLPSDWIATSNSYSRRTGIPLRLRKSSGRAHYQEMKYTKSAGRHAELLSQGMSGSVSTTGEAGDIDTAAHEFGHRMENVDPRIKRLEWTFYQWRTGNSLEPQTRIYAGKKELARSDRFVELYMGKDYGNAVTSYYELLSMGLEDLLFGVYGADAEYQEFVLGLLALI